MRRVTGAPQRLGVTASSDVVALYDRHAAAWSAARLKSLFEKPWLDRFLDIVSDGHRRVLDLGCGTGDPIARYLVQDGCAITGVDGAGAMIAEAKRAFPDQHWVQADMRHLPELGRFGGILAWHSFFHLGADDQRRMFGIFGALAEDGAALMFTSGPKAGEAIGTVEGEPLYHASLDAEEYTELLRANGFETVRHVAEDPECDFATVWLARRVA